MISFDILINVFTVFLMVLNIFGFYCCLQTTQVLPLMAIETLFWAPFGLSILLLIVGKVSKSRGGIILSMLSLGVSILFMNFEWLKLFLASIMIFSFSLEVNDVFFRSYLISCYIISLTPLTMMNWAKDKGEWAIFKNETYLFFSLMSIIPFLVTLNLKKTSSNLLLYLFWAYGFRYISLWDNQNDWNVMVLILATCLEARNYVLKASGFYKFFFKVLLFLFLKMIPMRCFPEPKFCNYFNDNRLNFKKTYFIKKSSSLTINELLKEREDNELEFTDFDCAIFKLIREGESCLVTVKDSDLSYRISKEKGKILRYCNDNKTIPVEHRGMFLAHSVNLLYFLKNDDEYVLVESFFPVLLGSWEICVSKETLKVLGNSSEMASALIIHNRHFFKKLFLDFLFLMLDKNSSYSLKNKLIGNSRFKKYSNQLIILYNLLGVKKPSHILDSGTPHGKKENILEIIKGKAVFINGAEESNGEWIKNLSTGEKFINEDGINIRVAFFEKETCQTPDLSKNGKIIKSVKMEDVEESTRVALCTDNNVKKFTSEEAEDIMEITSETGRIEINLGKKFFGLNEDFKEILENHGEINKLSFQRKEGYKDALLKIINSNSGNVDCLKFMDTIRMRNLYEKERSKVENNEIVASRINNVENKINAEKQGKNRQSVFKKLSKEMEILEKKFVKVEQMKDYKKPPVLKIRNLFTILTIEGEDNSTLEDVKHEKETLNSDCFVQGKPTINDSIKRCIYKERGKMCKNKKEKKKRKDRMNRGEKSAIERILIFKKIDKLKSKKDDELLQLCIREKLSYNKVKVEISSVLKEKKEEVNFKNFFRIKKNEWDRLKAEYSKQRKIKEGVKEEGLKIKSPEITKKMKSYLLNAFINSVSAYMTGGLS